MPWLIGNLEYDSNDEGTMGLDGLFGEAEEGDYYHLDGLFHEVLGEDESPILDCNEQSQSGVTDNEGNDLIYLPILPVDTNSI